MTTEEKAEKLRDHLLQRNAELGLKAQEKIRAMAVMFPTVHAATTVAELLFRQDETMLMLKSVDEILFSDKETP